ncbi:hypothetical protein NTGBS_70018 [Candidatus Nitrotoga sp. BS]|nr:hypothetical protein NTGBS_70018 [Candidatus Nitrotoga sp. BS]
MLNIEIIAAPIFSTGDRRLTIKTAEAHYQGLECGGCSNLKQQGTCCN